MKSFIDRNKEAWDLDLNIAAAMRLQSRLQIRIEDAVSMTPTRQGEKPLLERIAEDSILLFNIIYVLCEEQAEKRGLTQEDFAARFDGDTIEAATIALLDELENFSRPAQRKVMQQLREAGDKISERATQKLTELIAKPEFLQMIEQEIEEETKNGLKRSSTSSPDSSE